MSPISSRRDVTTPPRQLKQRLSVPDLAAVSEPQTLQATVATVATIVEDPVTTAFASTRSSTVRALSGHAAAQSPKPTHADGSNSSSKVPGPGAVTVLSRLRALVGQKSAHIPQAEQRSLSTRTVPKP